MVNSGIIGVGRFLPEKKVILDDFVRMGANLESLKRWGVSEHRIADKENVIEMEVKAGLEAIKSAGLGPDDIDLVIGSTIGSVRANPPNINLTINELGIRHAAAFEVNQSSNSPIPAMIIANTFVSTNLYKHVLLIASSYIKDVIDPTDPAIFAVLGDGASAVVVGKVENNKGFLGADLISDGKYWDKVGIEYRNAKHSDKKLTSHRSQYYFVDEVINSRSEFIEFIQESVPNSVKRLLTKEEIAKEEIDWVIPHQNLNTIFKVWIEKFDVNLNKAISTHEKFGNLGPANIWVNLYEGVKNKLIKDGDVLLFVGQGSGFSVGSMLLKW